MCGPILLYNTKKFANGGYLFSMVMMIISGYFTTVCALKLIQLAKKYRLYSYSQIVNKCIERNGQIVLDIMIPPS